MIPLQLAVASVLLGAASPVATTVPPPPPLTDAQLAESVTDIRPGVSDLDLRVRDVESRSTEGSETVVSLSTDVLFEFGKAVLPPAGPGRLGQLLAAAPTGAALRVHGFTDSIGAPDANLALSRARAEAVAAAIRGARPDLVLEVAGFGEARPVAPNTVGGSDNPDGRAQNRRVELRYR